VESANTACGSCAEHCPTQAVHMVPFKDNLMIPEIDPDRCVGCGACEHVCPTRPYRAVYVDGNPGHRQALPPTKEKVDQTVPEGFPF
jgi:formate hydrogenlyase subunit 6/NADH:ubiquinone oxidoreductase subunit I